MSGPPKGTTTDPFLIPLTVVPEYIHYLHDLAMSGGADTYLTRGCCFRFSEKDPLIARLPYFVGAESVILIYRPKGRIANGNVNSRNM